MALRGKYSGMSAIGSGNLCAFFVLHALTHAGVARFSHPSHLSKSMMEATAFGLRFGLDLFACESMLDCGGFALVFEAKSAGVRAKNFTKFRLCIVFPLLLDLLFRLLGYQNRFAKSLPCYAKLRFAKSLLLFLRKIT